jgi:hypothetical protein
MRFDQSQMPDLTATLNNNNTQDDEGDENNNLYFKKINTDTQRVLMTRYEL